MHWPLCKLIEVRIYAGGSVVIAVPIEAWLTHSGLHSNIIPHFFSHTKKTQCAEFAVAGCIYLHIFEYVK